MEVIVAREPMDYEIRGMYRFATLREESGLAEAVRGAGREPAAAHDRGRAG